MMTALLRVVGNERSSPILLSYESDIVQTISDQIAEQERSIQQIKESLGTRTDIPQKFCQAMELEVLRWNYVLHVYHSTRFKKIQALMSQMKLPMDIKLSPPEKAFCETLGRAIDAALSGGGSEFTEETEDLSSFVFFRPLEDIEPTLLSQSETAEAIPLQHGQTYFARLAHVKEFLDQGRVILV